jgi:hypothetical protein
MAGIADPLANRLAADLRIFLPFFSAQALSARAHAFHFRFSGRVSGLIHFIFRFRT